MTATDTRFVTDDAGQRVAVLIGLDRYRELLDAAGEVEAVRAYGAAKERPDESVPFDEAVREIELGRDAG